MNGVNFTCVVKPRMDGPDPDDVMRRDILDELGMMRRRLRGMVFEAEQRRAHERLEAERARKRGGRKSITAGGGPAAGLREPTAHERDIFDRYGTLGIQILDAEQRRTGRR